jgi:hypothetical protein
MTLRDHIEGLERNINALQRRLDEMNADEYCPPHHCCPSCYWGREMDDVIEKLERRQHYRRVLLCRVNSLKPKKVRTVRVKVYCCTGRTTMFSVGRCRCGEPDCPGRGICHTCKGTGRTWGEKKITTRPWPVNIKEIDGEGLRAARN